ncbi:hypothetical protein CC1G_15206 [Coprinopsis cinerea okayama7|uniref:Uncharacterized protein n=1 Tax=Coprinopsis cinerea (strain Okayama-7 / 130 / ATCC MYA-4618 / FGSC 9003) TaxID=240176 RepID=D6RPJ1_COPC7|nr:hypothetical protein CC1G_15206 [Coprinopsis cinerea okayama7\|eukprot:XP_002910571.1 hypothetical protein CC1G_15206 [Coprinopsis cinerea okayama7\
MTGSGDTYLYCPASERLQSLPTAQEPGAQRDRGGKKQSGRARRSTFSEGGHGSSGKRRSADDVTFEVFGVPDDETRVRNDLDELDLERGPDRAKALGDHEQYEV